jgi:hypothetical protein
MTPQEEARALANVDSIRRQFPMKFLQVLPDPHFADNVQLRLHGRGGWHTLHRLDAIAFLHRERRRQRRQRKKNLVVTGLSEKLLPKEPIHRTRLRAALIAMFNIDEIKARRDALLKKGITP